MMLTIDMSFIYLSRPVLTVCGHWPHVATEHVKCDESKLKCAVSVKSILDFKDLVEKKCKLFLRIICKNLLFINMIRFCI